MAEQEKERRSKGLLIGLIAFLVWAIGAAIVVVFVIMRPPDFSESPLVSRDIPNYDDDSPIGLLEQLSLPPRSGRLAEKEFLKPVRIDGTESNFVFHWKGEKKIEPETLPERVADGLLGDDEIELFAFATWTPGADDEIEIEEEFDHDIDKKWITVSNGDWKAPLTFRDPKTLEVFSDEKLDELEIPDSFRTAAPPQRYKTGLVRLLFRSANMGPVRFVGGSGGDSVTGGKVTYSLSSLGRESDQASVDEWTHYDFALLLWHDKPLKFHIQVLTGEPEYADLPQQLGEQVVFGERVRLQWLTRGDGYFNTRENDYFTPTPGVDHKLLKGIAKRASEEEEASIISWDSFPGSTPSLSAPSTLPTPAETSAEPDADDDAEDKTDTESEEDEKSPALYRVDNDFAAHVEVSTSSSGTTVPDTFFRISDQKYVDHLGRIDEDGEVTWDFDSDGKSEEIRFASCKHTRIPGEPLRLVFLPHLAELTFEIAGTPDVPNPGDIEDLFDQKIPRLTLSDSDPEGAETELMQFIAVATQSGINHSDLWEESWPSSMPRDRTFRDTTPQLLLNWYLESTPEAFIHHDTDRLLLLSNQDEESFWDKVVNFFDGLF